MRHAYIACLVLSGTMSYSYALEEAHNELIIFIFGVTTYFVQIQLFFFHCHNFTVRVVYFCVINLNYVLQISVL